MTAELVAGLVALIVTLIGGSVGWQQIREHGEERERRRQAEADLETAQAELDASWVAPANRDEASSVLRRRLARLGRKLKRMRDESQGRG